MESLEDAIYEGLMKTARRKKRPTWRDLVLLAVFGLATLLVVFAMPTLESRAALTLFIAAWCAVALKFN